eukprot:1158396-Pelagomonas_calceolata.AAC.10
MGAPFVALACWTSCSTSHMLAGASTCTTCAASVCLLPTACCAFVGCSTSTVWRCRDPRFPLDPACTFRPSSAP